MAFLIFGAPAHAQYTSVTAQNIMSGDGSEYAVPTLQYTNSQGIGTYTFTTLLSLSAATHTIEVQGYTTSSSPVYVTRGTLNMVELG